MRATMRNAVWVLIAIICGASQMTASDSSIHGIVTDNAGKPIRGAEVRATSGDTSVTRFSQQDGRYEIVLPAGSYEVSAGAFGYAPRRLSVDTAQANETNFSLSPRWAANRLSGAEIDHLLPNEPPANLIRASCTNCHDFDVILRHTGQTAAEWKSFIPVMTRGRRYNPVFSPAKLDALSQGLAKYFGPESQYFGPDAQPPSPQQVSHPQLADAALTATIHEFTIPGGADAFPHSIEVASPNVAYFAEVGSRADRFGRFDLETGKFKEWPAPAVPHTGAVAKDGRVWEAVRFDSGSMAQFPGGSSPNFDRTTLPNLTVLNPQTGEMKSYKFVGKNPYTAHTPVIDQDGNIWLSVEYHSKANSASPIPAEVWKFDVKTEQFKAYKIPMPAKFPEGSVATWEMVPGDTESSISASTYHVGVDSKGMIWASILQLGMLVRIDPRTGETKEYVAPDTPGIRGMTVDHHDNVWFADFYHHRLGKLDTKTSTFHMYTPPTAGAAPYGVIEDKNTGYIWYADFSSSTITRFDPKTERFVEYPLPLHPSVPRFIDVDSKSRIWFTEYWNGKIGYIDTGEPAKEALASR